VSKFHKHKNIAHTLLYIFFDSILTELHNLQNLHVNKLIYHLKSTDNFLKLQEKLFFVYDFIGQPVMQN